MENREHPIVWVIGPTRSCKTPIAEHGVAPLGFGLISTATYFRERFAQPDTLCREYILSLSEFAANCLAENPSCHRDHLTEKIRTLSQRMVIEGERNPDEFVKLYDPQIDMVVIVNRVEIDSYDTHIEHGIPVIVQYLEWTVNIGIAPYESVIKTTFGNTDIKAEYLSKHGNPSEVIIAGTIEMPPADQLAIDRYPWIGIVNRIVMEQVGSYYGLPVPDQLK